MTRNTVIDLNLEALDHNFRHVKSLAPKSKILAMVKANAYGHDLFTIANALDTVDALGVACIDEAIALRQYGNQSRIVLMEGIFTGEELALADHHRFDIVVHHPFQVALLKELNWKHALQIWLKMETGMHRLGLDPTVFMTSLHALETLGKPLVPPILMTHFACADELENPMTLEQLSVFNTHTDSLPYARSTANSAATLHYPQTHLDWIRPGLVLYGISPFQDVHPNTQSLKPVMRLRSNLIAIHDCVKGDKVGYGSTWTCPEDMRIGVIAIGYGDGYPREIAPNTPVLLNNQRVPIIGTVSMDKIAIDLRTINHVSIGDPVFLWNETLLVNEIAQAANTIPYTLLCNMSRRIGRKG